MSEKELKLSETLTDRAERAKSTLQKTLDNPNFQELLRRLADQ